MQKPRPKRKIVIVISVILVLLLACAGGMYYWYSKKTSVTSYAECVAEGNPVMDSHPNQCQTMNGKSFTDPNATQTFEGSAVCLPHKDTDGPQTLECAMGLKVDDGTYYGVSGDKSNVLSGVTESDKKVRITGTLEPSNTTKYDIKQIIAVKSIEVIE